MTCVVFDFPLSLSFICTKPLRECVVKQRFKPTPRDTHLSVKKSLEKALVSVAAMFCVLNCLNKNHCFQPGSCVRSHLCVQGLSTFIIFIWPIALSSLGVLWNSRGNSFSGAVMKFTSVNEALLPWEDSLDDTCCNFKLELIELN